MWNQPLFNQPPNPYGGYILVPVGGPTSPTTPTTPSTTMKPKSLKKALAQAARDRDALDVYIKTLEDKKKGDKKPDDKKEEKKLNLLHMSMLLMMTAPFLGLFELYCLKILAAGLIGK